ncbi:MAG: flavin reductase family protein [Candidatus Methanomethylicaceae archaeon]
MGNSTPKLEALYYRLLSPRIPLVVVALKDDGLPNAMVAAWHMPVTVNPPVLALSIAPDRLTYRLIQSGGEFTVNIPPPSLLDKVKKSGTFSGRSRNKSTLFGYVKGSKIKTPVIAESMGSIECTLNRIIEMGDHSIVLGNVVAVRARDFDDVWLSSPLLHLGGIKYVTFRDL